MVWSGTDVAAFAAADLPPTWVLKPNHGSGRVHIGTGRPEVAALRRITAGWLDEPLYRERGEWVYSQARRLLLAEEFLGSGEPPVDLKFLVFAGRVELVQVDTGRFGDHRRRLYTPDWTAVDVVEAVAPGPLTGPPAQLPRMLEVASALGAGYDFVRVDLYEVDGEVWFSELTPYPGGGLDAFDPALDSRLGALWQLPPRSAVRAGQQRLPRGSGRPTRQRGVTTSSATSSSAAPVTTRSRTSSQISAAERPARPESTADNRCSPSSIPVRWCSSSPSV